MPFNIFIMIISMLQDASQSRLLARQAKLKSSRRNAKLKQKSKSQSRNEHSASTITAKQLNEAWPGQQEDRRENGAK
jgi:hypothetical protein